MDVYVKQVVFEAIANVLKAKLDVRIYVNVKIVQMLKQALIVKIKKK